LRQTAYKLNKENCKIDWTKSAKEIFNLIRGLSPILKLGATWTDQAEPKSLKQEAEIADN
jgi:methionyl-tRNA formyltransferase